MPGPPVARRGPTSLVAASALAATLVSLAVAPATTAVAAARRPVPAAGALVTTASAASPAAGSYATDRLLVRFADGAPRQAQAHALEIAGASAPERVDGTPYVRVAVTGDLTRTIVALSADQAVAEVQRVYRRRATGLPAQPSTTAQPSASRSFGPPVIPTDPAYAKSEAANARLMRLPAAWAVRHTSPMIVAVVDTGVDLKHPDLAGRLVPGYDFVENDNKPQDGNGHGTQVAGIIGAAPDNKRGIAGVVWNARIMPVRVLDADGYGFDDTIAKGIVWAANHGASVINLSLGGPEADDVLRTAVDYATRKGALVVVAAGNDGTGVTQYPAAYSSALAVAATDSTGALTQFSSYGDWVDVAAPGWNVLSTALRFPGASDYVTESGTSFSAPYVSGIAALVRAQHPTWTVAHVRRHSDRSRRGGTGPRPVLRVRCRRRFRGTGRGAHTPDQRRRLGHERFTAARRDGIPGDAHHRPRGRRRLVPVSRDGTGVGPRARDGRQLVP
jgi:subtilisin family serine protease